MRVIARQNLPAADRACAIAVASQDAWQLVRDAELLRAIEEIVVDACGTDESNLEWYDHIVKQIELQLDRLKL